MCIIIVYVHQFISHCKTSMGSISESLKPSQDFDLNVKYPTTILRPMEGIPKMQKSIELVVIKTLTDEQKTYILI